MRQSSVLVAAVLSLAPASTRAQDSPAFQRRIFFEARVGTTETIGNPGRTLIGPDDAIGFSGGVHVSSRLVAWGSADFRPSNSSRLYPGPGLSPAVTMYALSAGASVAVGPQLGRTRLRPLELGLGAGATKLTAEWRGYGNVTEPPVGAEAENPYSAGLLSAGRWRPTVAARLRLAFPLGRVARLSGTAALLVTPVGDMRLWDGGWEATGEGNRYRPTSEVWSYGTVFAVPLTLGVGFQL